MIDYDSMEDRLVIFGSIFTVSNRLQSVMDQQLPELSAKQWFVLTMLSFFEHPPSLIGLAKVCDSSYQNIKQIVLKLQEKGFVILEDDADDKRAKRVVMTSKVSEWSAKTHELANQFVNTLFEPLSAEQINELRNSLLTLHKTLGEMQNEEKS
jgi:Transcriptional regulators